MERLGRRSRGVCRKSSGLQCSGQECSGEERYYCQSARGCLLHVGRSRLWRKLSETSATGVIAMSDEDRWSDQCATVGAARLYRAAPALRTALMTR